MPLAPRTPNPNDPKDVERYEKDIESLMNNPTAWGIKDQNDKPSQKEEPKQESVAKKTTSRKPNATKTISKTSSKSPS